MIKNINKKFIASSVALTLLPWVLTGCTVNTFKYNNGDNHEIAVSGVVSYDFIKECYYVEIENPDYDKIEYYIANKAGYYSSDNTLVGYFYYDLLTNKEIYRRNKDDYNYFNESSNVTNRKFVKEIKVEDYLFSENLIKNAYDVNDVKQIFEAIKENVAMDEANEMKAKFEEAGATIEFK